jgi:hypothetical protein
VSDVRDLLRFAENRVPGNRREYVTSRDDPLHDPTARKWVDSPLRPPAK